MDLRNETMLFNTAGVFPVLVYLDGKKKDILTNIIANVGHSSHQVMRVVMVLERHGLVREERSKKYNCRYIIITPNGEKVAGFVKKIMELVEHE